MLVIGVDIGGTKCAVSLGEITESGADIIHKCCVRKTAEHTPPQMLDLLAEDILSCVGIADGSRKIQGIGISCGGPLNSKTGIILSPPNLPGWDSIPITDYFQSRT